MRKKIGFFFSIFNILICLTASPGVASGSTGSADWSQRFTSPESVLEGYRAKLAEIGPKDPRGLFLRVYIEISEEMMIMFDHQEFRHQDWIKKLMVDYANLYREAFHDDEIHSAHLSLAWELAFNENRKNPADFFTNQLLAAINAHVNRDLPYALIESGADFDRQDYQWDFQHIGAAFFRRMPHLWKVLSEYEGCERPFWERQMILRVIDYVMTQRRDESWTKAKKYAEITDPVERQTQMFELERFAEEQYQTIKKSFLPPFDHRACSPSNASQLMN